MNLDEHGIIYLYLLSLSHLLYEYKYTIPVIGSQIQTQYIDQTTIYNTVHTRPHMWKYNFLDVVLGNECVSTRTNEKVH